VIASAGTSSLICSKIDKISETQSAPEQEHTVPRHTMFLRLAHKHDGHVKSRGLGQTFQHRKRKCLVSAIGARSEEEWLTTNENQDEYWSQTKERLLGRTLQPPATTPPILP